MNILLSLLVVFITTSCTTIPAGYRGIKVDVLGSGKGSVQEISSGRHFWGLNIQYHMFPVFNQNYVWTKSSTEGSNDDESFTFSINGMPVNIDIGIEYSLTEGNIADLFLKYRKNVDELTDITIRNIVRDNFNSLSVEYNIDTLMSGGMTELVNRVEENTREYFSKDGIVINSISLVNAPRYPQSIVEAIEEKNKATQRAIQRENELREVEAEAKKRISQETAQYEIAKLQAKANRELANSYTPNLIEKLRIEKDIEWVKKWNGQLPATVAGDSTLLMQPK